MVTTEQSNRLAYKDMKLSYYLLGTLGFYAVIIAGAIIIKNVTTIFDFVAAFAITATAFIFPGLFYLKGIKRYGGSKRKFVIMSYVYLALGLVNCIVGLTSTIIGLAYPAATE